MFCFSCQHRYDDPDLVNCEHCQSSLEINGLRAIAPLKPIDAAWITSVWEVEGLDGCRKVLRMVAADNEAMVASLQATTQLIQALAPLDVAIPSLSEERTFFWVDSADKHSFCIVLERIEGSNLLDYCQAVDVNPGEVMDWLHQLLMLAEQFHAQGFVLGDIKPSNLIRQPSGRLVYVDIDAILRVDYRYIAELGVKFPNGYVAGSVGYASPEQSAGRTLPASDLFSIGRTVVHLLTQRPPANLIDEHGQFVWHPDLKDDVHPLLIQFLDRLMALNPIDRPGLEESLEYVTSLPKRIERSERLKPYRAQVLIGGGIMAMLASIPLLFSLYSAALTARANYLQLKGELAPARNLYGKAIQANGQNALAHTGLALACAATSEIDCATQSLERALSLAPDNDAIRYNLASLYDREGKFDRAVELYEGITGDSAVFFKSQNNLARVNIVTGNVEKAIQILELIPIQSDKINKDLEAIIYKNLGWSYLENSQKETALQFFDLSTQSNPSYGDPYCFLAKLKQQDNLDYQADFITCLSLSPNSPEATQIRSDLLKTVFN